MTTTAPTITASAGAGGTNVPADVRVVQDLLNRAARASPAVDGVCGPGTRQALTSYQSTFLRTADGRVDPGGPTLRHLAAESRDGHYSYSSTERRYGTAAMLQLLTSTAAALHRTGLEYGAGDVSFRQGGRMPPHSTHHPGRPVDLRPLRTDNARGPVSLGGPRYSREATRTLVETLLAQGTVRRILFNDPEIPDVRRYPGHDNHLHIEVGSQGRRSDALFGRGHPGRTVVVGVHLGEQAEQGGHGEPGLGGMTQDLALGDPVRVAAALARVGQIAALLQIRNDLLHGALGEPAVGRDVTDPRALVLGDGRQYARMVGDERPSRVRFRRSTHGSIVRLGIHA
jgi:hypothetical protein